MGRIKELFRRKEKIRNDLHRRVIQKYSLNEFKNLQELITTINDDTDFCSIVKTFGYHVLKPSPGVGNINYNENDGLHWYVWSYYESIDTDTKEPITEDSDITIEELVKCIVEYCVYADRCYPKAYRDLEYGEKHKVFDTPIKL